MMKVGVPSFLVLNKVRESIVNLRIHLMTTGKGGRPGQQTIEQWVRKMKELADVDT